MPDIWNGKRLKDRRQVMETIHYRLYDGNTDKLLAFDSTNAFDGIATVILRTAREHPNARIVAVRYDGPVY